MNVSNKIDSYDVTVEPFHVDFTGRMFLGILGNHMLNAAGRHSQRRGWGIGALNAANHTWVLSRLSIEMWQMPRQNEAVQIQTWVESVIRLFTNRNFAVLRPDGTPYGYARSTWAMIDTQTRKPCDLLSYAGGDILRYVVSPEEKACPIEGHGRFRFRDPQLVRTIETHYSDVDINGHINSIKYIEHILDLFQPECFRQPGIRFEVAYKTEAYMGDRLSFYSQPGEGGETDFEIRKDSGDVVCQAKVRFLS